MWSMRLTVGLCLGLAATTAVRQDADDTGEVDPGQIGLRFMGNEYVSTKPFMDFPADDFTITMKVKAVSGNLLSYGIEGGAFDGQHFGLVDVDNLIITRGSADPWTTNVGLGDGVWHALAVTWKKSTGVTKVYKDGMFVVEMEMSREVSVTGGGLMVLGQLQRTPIGSFPEGTGLDGVIADMTLWSRELTAHQVNYLAFNAPSGDEQDLVSFWPLNEKDGIITGRDETNINSFYLGGPTTVTDVGMNVATHSLQFKAQDLVVLTPTSDLPTGDLTVEFWIKTQTDKDCNLVTYYMDSDGSEPFAIKNPGNLQMDHNGETIKVATGWADGVWNHVAMAWIQADGQLLAYKNGGLVYPPAWLPVDTYDRLPRLDQGGSLPARPDRMVVGGRINKLTGASMVDGFGFDGELQELRIWNVARTQEQIEQLKNFQLPLDPLPSGAILYWNMDEMETSLVCHDSAGTNVGLLSKPTWENTLIAPPFPTLDEVNGEVAVLKSEMADLLEYVKVVMDPSLNTSAAVATVAEPAACDRRYSYLCKTETKILADAAAAKASSAVTNLVQAPSSSALSSRSHKAQAKRRAAFVETNSASNMMQNAMHASHGSTLSADITANSHAHVRAPTAGGAGHKPMPYGHNVRVQSGHGVKPVQSRVTGSHAHGHKKITQLANELLQTGETSSDAVTMADDPAEVERVSALPVEASFERGRHVWAEGKSSPLPGAQETQAGTGYGHHRHAWSEGKQTSGPVSDLRRNLVHNSVAEDMGNIEFVEEMADVVEDVEDKRHQLVTRQTEESAAEVPGGVRSTDDDYDDQGPEAVARSHHDSQRSGSKLARAFVSHQKPPEASGSPTDKLAPLTVSKTPVHPGGAADQSEEAAWGSADFDQLRDSFAKDFVQAAVPDEASMAVPAVDGRVPSMLADDALLQVSEGVRARKHHRHKSGESSTHHHHHRHHRQNKALDRTLMPKPHSDEDVADDNGASVMVEQRGQLLKTAAAAKENGTPAKETGTPAKVDNGGMGGAFEQVIMPGAETEWDEAIAEGVSNSDLSEDGGVSTDDIAVAV